MRVYIYLSELDFDIVSYVVLSVYLPAYMYIYTCIYAHKFVCTYRCVHVCIYTSYGYRNIRHSCMYIYTYTQTAHRICICTYLFIYTHTHTCTYILCVKMSVMCLPLMGVCLIHVYIFMHTVSCHPDAHIINIYIYTPCTLR